MILQKRRLYSNKLFNKHYKKLNDIFFSKRGVLIPSVANTSDEQLIHISVLTTDTVSHKNFPNIIEIAFSNNLNKSKKATMIFQGKTKISKKSIHLLTKFFCFSSKTVSKLQNNNNTNSFLSFAQDPKKEAAQGTKESQLDTSFKVIDKMVGAGIDMHHYKVCLSRKDPHLFRLASITSQGIKTTKTIKNQLMLSKAELSSTIIQIISKVYSLKSNKQAHFANTLSNIVGALIVVNSIVYYISDYELKQCGLIGSFKQSPITNLRKYSVTMQSSLLKKLLNAKKIEDKKAIVGIQTFKPNTAIFNFLKTSICAGIFHDCKKILSQLLSILVKNSIVKK